MASTEIHPTAIIEDGAELGDRVRIGPYAVVGAHVVLGEGCSVGPHAVVTGHTTLGPRNSIFQFASIGEEPQDLKYAGEPTRLEVGEGNTFREFVTVNRATVSGGGVTTIGDGNLLMAYSHVAHDCLVGSRCVMANGATLAGHVQVDDGAIIGGLVAIHQFVRVGGQAILGGGAMVSLDVPPFCMAAGDRAKLHGLNIVGLRRSGVDEDTIKRLRSSYRTLFQSSLRLREALAQLRTEHADSAHVQKMLDFIENSERGICR